MFRIKMLFAGVLLAMLLAGNQNLRGQSSSGTVLLFNYVTNQSNFDTTVVISNTPMDPSGSTSQPGACVLNYYGDTNGQAMQTAQQSASVTPGGQLSFSLSAGNSNGIAASPGFQGYIIANCDFPFGQGTAKISDALGSRFLSIAPAIVLGNANTTLSRLFPPVSNTTAMVFNFVTNQTNFDTKLVIANSTMDPFGTTAVSGACKFYYYGAAGITAPPTQQSASIDPGTALYVTLSGGGSGIAPAPGFQGSIIASCDFPFAQGTALITDPASAKYLSVVPATTLDRAVPVANAGASRNVTVGTPASLDGSGSTDADNDPLTYSWTTISIPSGSSASLSGAGTVAPSFTPDLAGTYVFQLIVNDGFTNSAPSTVSMTATALATASINFTPANVAISGTVTQNLTLTLSGPAPAQGQIINLYSSTPAIAAVLPTVTFSPGANTVSVPVTTLAPGTVVIHASSLPNIAETTATITVASKLSTAISFTPQNVTVNGPSTVQYATLTLAGTAPATGLLINLTSDNPGVATVPTSVTFAPNSRTITVPVTGVVPGTAVIHANALPTVPDATLNVTVTPKTVTVIKFNPAIATISAGVAQSLTLTLSVPAPANGLTFSLSSSNPSAATVPATVTCPANTTTVNIPIIGVGAGTAVIHASAPPDVADTTANVTVVPFVGSAPAIMLPNASVGQNLETALTFTLTQPAPSGGLQVTFTSSDPSKLLVAGHENVQGSNTLTVTVPQGVLTLGGVFVQSLASAGTVTLTASAPNYASGTASLALTPSGFVIAGPQGATIFSANQGVNTPLTISAARLDSSLNVAEVQQVRGGYTTSVDITSSTPAVGTISNTPVTFNGGDTTATTQFVPLIVGTTTISVSTPTDFTLPATGTSVTASVSPSGLVPGRVTVGQGLESAANIFLKGSTPTGGLMVTLTSNSPTLFLLSNTPGGAGSTSINITIPQGFTVSQTFFIYALANSGSGTYTASAAGFGNTTATITLGQSAIIISGPSGGQSFFSTTGAPNTNLTVTSGLVDSSGTFTQQAVAGGGTLSVTVNSSNTSVGTITQSPVTIPAGSSTATTQFDPSAPGTSTITAVAPTGFTTLSGLNTVLAKVSTAGLAITDGDTIGQNLQDLGTVLLGQAAPNGGLQVTITSNSPNLMLLSTSKTAAGSASIKITIPSGAVSGSYYMQSLSSSGTVSYTASASGFSSRTAQATMVPSGVVIQGPFGFNVPFPFPTNVGDTTQLIVSTAQLDPSSGAYVNTQPLAGGQTLSVTLSNANPTAGTVTSPLTIPGGNDSATATFTSKAAGSTTITVVKPANLVTRAASNNTTVSASVH